MSMLLLLHKLLAKTVAAKFPPGLILSDLEYDSHEQQRSVCISCAQYEKGVGMTACECCRPVLPIFDKALQSRQYL